MKFECTRTLELLERRLELVRALIRVDAEWRLAFIALNLEQSERCAAEEERLSLEVRALDEEIASLDADRSPKPLHLQATEMERTTDRRIHDALDRMLALHLELKRSNEIRKSILKRSKITLNALRNLFNSHASTYAAPAAPTTGTMCEERA
jgi:hypothetical protein